MVQEITEQVLEAYICDSDDLERMRKNDVDYFRNCLSRAITDQNPSYCIEKLAEEYNESSLELREFVEKKWETVVDPSAYEYISEEVKRQWIQATVRGICDYNKMTGDEK